MTFMPINTAVEASRRLSRSALPDAPVVEDDDRRERRLGAAVRALLGRRAAGPARRTHTAATRKPAESC